MNFEFATAARIVFGPGSAGTIGAAVRALGARALLVTGRDASRAAPFRRTLTAAGVECAGFAITGEPTVPAVREGAAAFRDARCDVVIAFGGGSVIDGGKAIAAIAANSGDVLDYLEVVGRAQPFENAPHPFVAIPTTAGTGSEVTRNAVLGSPEHGVKASLRSPLMLARLAVVDPELTFGLPPAITAATGLDALTQLIEPYVSGRANAMTSMFCADGMRRVARSLRLAYENGSHGDAREDMSFASLLGGLSLANAGLGVVHGFAAPIGGSFDAPHGAVCAAVLPHGMSANIEALLKRHGAEHPAFVRYKEVAAILTGKPHARAEDGVEWVRDLCRDLHIPPLSAYGITTADVPGLVANAAKASSTKANPIVLNEEELSKLIEGAI